MSASRGKDRLDPAGKAVGFVHPLQKAGNSTRADGDMAPDFNVSGAQFARYYRDFFTCLWAFDEEKLGRQKLTKPSMQFDDRRGRCWWFRLDGSAL
jgi:hypothetical protein